jgi:hypothetical protein
MPIQEVEISYEEDWVKLHLHALRTAYGKSPFFMHYQDGLEKIFHTKPRYLYDFNMTALQWVLALTGIRLPIHETDTYSKEPMPDVAWYRDYKWPTPGVINTQPVPYVQVWSHPGTFCYHLSILDVIFCAGPGTGQILKDFSQL